tara:strand:- start:300 stop:620 length:321 start_codon:yes stop_codon:yes gene_type:complete
MGKYWLANTPDGALLAGSKTEDMISIVAAAELDFDVTVTGAAMGDMVLGVSFEIDLDPDVSISYYVSAADTVTVVLCNNSTATVDFASTTVRALVLPKAGVDNIIA